MKPGKWLTGLLGLIITAGCATTSNDKDLVPEMWDETELLELLEFQADESTKELIRLVFIPWSLQNIYENIMLDRYKVSENEYRAVFPDGEDSLTIYLFDQYDNGTHDPCDIFEVIKKSPHFVI